MKLMKNQQKKTEADMKLKIKRFLSTILCLSMLLGMTSNIAYAMDTADNTTEDVIGMDEEGNIWTVEDDTSGVVVENIRSRSASTKIVNFRANAEGIDVTTTTTYNEYDTGNIGYLYGKSGADAAYLGMEDGKVKFMISGVIGLVDASAVQVVNMSSVASYSNYYANGTNLIHNVCTNMTSSQYGATINVGPQPSYLRTGVTYYSYDGHYFYTDYDQMISDYVANTRVNSINEGSPYYNYYQYLPLRSTTVYSANELFNMINAKTSTSSKLYNTGSTFVSYQNTYGVNALLMASVAAVESGWGTSGIAKSKNNLFGLNAVDSSPGESANYYSSVTQCIKEFAEIYMSKRYLRAGYTYYNGGFLGNKASGINVRYASDPYWGEKIAAVAWSLDATNGGGDQCRYTIGIKDTYAYDHTNLNVRQEATTASTVLYQTGNCSHYAFIIWGESNNFYQVQSDPVLVNGRSAVDTSTGVYNVSSMYAYASKDYVTVVSEGVLSDTGMQTENISSGVYYIHPKTNSNYALDIAGASKNDSANLQLYSSNGTSAQQFYIEVKNGYCTIKNLNSNKMLDVAGAGKFAGTNVWQYSNNESSAQKWKIIENEDGSYSFVSVLNGLVLDIAGGIIASGSNAQVYTRNGTDAQKFVLESAGENVTGCYYIHTKANANYVLDIQGASVDEQANLQLYSLNGTKAQQFYIESKDGYSTIKNVNSNKMLDVAGAGMTAGTNVWQYGSNETDAQKWQFIKNEDGSYSCISVLNGLALDIEDGIATSGNNVQVYTPNGTNAQKFILNEVGEAITGYYYIQAKSNTNYVLDIAGAGKNDGANLQLYSMNGTKAQQFYIESKDGYCTIKNVNSGKVLDVYDAGMKAGTNVWQYSSNGTNAQKWKSVLNDDGSYSFISLVNGLALDVYNGIIASGSNVQVYTLNGTDAQKFVLKRVK